MNAEWDLIWNAYSNMVLVFVFELIVDMGKFVLMWDACGRFSINSRVLLINLYLLDITMFLYKAF